MHLVRLSISLLALVVVIGCTGQPSSSAEIPSGGVVRPVCVSFSILIERITDFQNLDLATASSDDVKFAGRQVVQAYRDFVANAEAVAAANYDQLQAAEDALENAVEALPAGTTGQAIAAAVKPLWDEFVTQVQTTGGNLACLTASPTPGS